MFSLEYEKLLFNQSESLARSGLPGAEDSPSSGSVGSSILMYSEVHRDIKTENILLQGDVPMVADFGLLGQRRL